MKYPRLASQEEWAKAYFELIGDKPMKYPRLASQEEWAKAYFELIGDMYHLIGTVNKMLLYPGVADYEHEVRLLVDKCTEKYFLLEEL